MFNKNKYKYKAGYFGYQPIGDNSEPPEPPTSGSNAIQSYKTIKIIKEIKNNDK